jgi:apolipoprotein N-acyltransferase
MRYLDLIRRVASGSNFWGRFLWTQVSGILAWMAFPNIGAHSSLAWFCFSFWLAAIREAGWKERFVHGFMMGFWYIVPDKWTVFWQIFVGHFTNFGVVLLLYGLFALSFIIPFVLFSLIPPIHSNPSLRSTFFRSAILTVLIAWTPSAFPVNPALMVHDWSIAMQTADLGGMPLVTFSIFWVNGLLAEILFYARRDRRRLWKYSLCLLLTVGFIVGYGAYRIHEQKSFEQKGNGHYSTFAALVTRYLPNEPLASLIRLNSKGGYSASELTELCAKHFPQASVIVWPELPVEITRNNESKLHERVSSLANKIQKRVIYSSMEMVGDSTAAVEYCTARLVLPDGTEAFRYRKNLLIPFFESSPFPKLARSPREYYRAGEEEAVFPIDDRTTAIPSLCYDLHSPRHLRNGIRMGGNIIVHMSSFFTFDDSPVPYIDYAIAKFYAVAYRVPIVRSTNRGYGAFIQATGEAMEGSETTPKDRKIKSFPLFIPEKRSLYFYLGDTFLYVLTVFVLGRAILYCMVFTRLQIIKPAGIYTLLGHNLSF